MNYKKTILTLTDTSVTQILKELLHVIRVNSICRDSEKQEIVCNITTIWDDQEKTDDVVLTEEKLYVPFSVNAYFQETYQEKLTQYLN